MTKHLTTFAAALVAITLPCYADQPQADSEEKAERHQEGSIELADEQDELSADVQQLRLEQTVEKVIKLLEEVEEAMDDASYRLEEHDTGGETIAAQTDVIEKIYEAAKERQKSSSSGSCSGAMMDMMERMMGKTPEGDKPGKKGEKPGDQGGEGMTGESDAANDNTAGDPDGRREERTLKKASGTAGRNVPAEFKKAFEAFNRGSENLAK
jgi:hypothetical protein